MTHTIDGGRALVERYLSAYNALDVPGMLAVLHPDVTFENISNGQVTASSSGREDFQRLAERAVTLFASRRQTLREYRAVAAGAEITIDYEGVLAVDIGPGMAAGDRVRLDGRSRFAFRDGLIAGIVDES